MSPRRLLSCDCCKDVKPCGEFSSNGYTGDYSYFCKSCQVWLRLFREVCALDNSTRKKAAPRGIQMKKYHPQTALDKVWRGNVIRHNLL